MTPIDELIASLTDEQVLERFLENLETIGLRARSWRPGGFARSILRVVATSFSQSTVVMAAFIRGGFLELAEGVWLTRLAKYVYGVERRPATFAVGEATFTNAGGGVYDDPSYGPDSVRVLWTAGKKAYVITEDLSLGALTSVTRAVRAVEIGAASSAPGLAIDDIETTLLGVTVSNLEPVFGSDEETDAELRQRCLDALAARSVRGPRGAYRYAVTSALRSDGSPVDINRISITPSSSTGHVGIVCASPAGPPLSTDLDLVRANIEKIARPDSVTVDLSGASATTLTGSIVVWAVATDGVSAEDLEAMVLRALDPVTRNYPIGGIAKPPATTGKLWKEYVTGLAKSAHPSIFDIDGFDADITIVAGHVVTLSMTVDVRINPNAAGPLS